MSAVTDTPGRLLRLLSLLQMPREWPGSELAERLGVSHRTVRRDIERLRELGYPVEATMGVGGGYRLAAGAAMPPLLLDDDEAVAIAVGLRTTARQPVNGIADASVRALAKVQQVLPTRLRQRVGVLTTATAPTEAALVDPEQLTALAAAAATNERVNFDYRDQDGIPSQRLAEPHRLVMTGRRWYLVAYDNERHDWRTFRADRIENTKSTGIRVPPRELPLDDAAAFVTSQLHDLAPLYAAVATLRLPAAQAAARLGDAAGTIEPLGAEECRWTSPADTVDWLAFRLASLGCDFVVHEPAELVDHLRRVGARIARATAG